MWNENTTAWGHSNGVFTLAVFRGVAQVWDVRLFLAMKRDDSNQETKPAGNKPPPRPPRVTATGFAPEDDPERDRRFGKNIRATIAASAHGEGRFIRRRSAGRGQYGHVQIQIEPNKRGKGIEVIFSVPNDEIPASYSKSIIEGVRLALESEMLIGHRVVDERCIDDIAVRVVGGSYEETDSNDLAFKMAGIFAVKDALMKTEPVKIE
jgi:Elongation factor G, domain IV